MNLSESVRHGMSKHAAYVLYEDGNWDGVKAFLVGTGFTSSEADDFIKENKGLILRYRDALVDWFEGEGLR